MSVARLYYKRTIIKDYDIAVETEWHRVPISDTPEWELCRKSMLERVGYDPLDMKVISLYKVIGTKIECDRQNNPKALANASYTGDSTKKDLLVAHGIIVAAVNMGLMPKEGNIDRWLLEQHNGFQSKLINFSPNIRYSLKDGS